MKKFLIIFTLLILSKTALARDIYSLDPAHTNITWHANHFGFSTPSGKFTRSNGTINFDAKSPQNSSVEITIDTNSIETGDAKFNEHLRGPDFLDTANFPEAKFISNKILLTGNNSAKISGDLTLHGITKVVTLEVRMNKLGNNPFTQKKTMGISAATVIKRSDFDIKFGIPGISDNVKIAIEAEAIISGEEAAPVEEKKDDQRIIYVPNPKWNLVKEGSAITFKAKQNNSEINGSFTNFAGQINFNKDEAKGNKVVIEIDTSSISMPFSQALDALKTEGWLAVQKFPKAVFVAEDFKAVSAKKMRSNGKLTIRDKTLPVNFDFEFSEYSKGDATASGSFTIKRTDFGVGKIRQNDVDDDVVISFKIKAQK